MSPRLYRCQRCNAEHGPPAPRECVIGGEQYYVFAYKLCPKCVDMDRAEILLALVGNAIPAGGGTGQPLCLDEPD